MALWRQTGSVRRFATAKHQCDYLIVGAGIVGASAGFELAKWGKVTLLERESAYAYHSTGRSAALYSETYGTKLIRALTTGSRKQYINPEPDLAAEHPFLSPRGTMWLARHDQLTELTALYEQLLGDGLVKNLRKLTTDQVCAAAPYVNKAYLGPRGGGVSEPDAMDIDVSGLHMAFLRGAKKRGATAHLSSDIVSIQYDTAAKVWVLRTATGEEYRAPVVVNAAGAWADVVGALAGAPSVQLQPKRRTIIRFPGPANVTAEELNKWPMVFDVAEEFYVKPDAGQMLASPADQTPVPPHDAAPEELDIAICVDRVQTWTTLEVKKLSASWAGLRSFVPDHEFVLGEEPTLPPGFVWACGQGGYGIQTAPAAGRVVAAVAANRDIPADLADLGVTKAALSPARLRAKA